jgi:hypothetical protein
VRAPFLATLVLTVTLACACFGAVMAVVMAAAEPHPIPRLGVTQRQDAETALYIVAFFVILPAAVWLVPRLADALSRGPNRQALPGLAALLAAGLALGVLAVRLSSVVPGGGGKAALLAMLCGWGAVAAALLWRAASARPWPLADRIAALERPLALAAGVLVLGTLLTVTRLASLDPLVLLLGTALAAAVALSASRAGLRPRRALAGRAGLSLDALAVILLLLAIPDLVLMRPEDPHASLLDRIVVGVIQFHHDFLLGPANQVLGGHALLVDNASQYGVGSIYFLTGWFELVPIGYGTMALLDGVLTALFFVAGYELVRLAGTGRILAGSALAVGVIALVLSRLYPVGALPQEGPLRFGLPLLVILAAVAAERLPRRAGAFDAAALATLALSSVWSLEAFALTAATLAVVVFTRVWLRPAGKRGPLLSRTAVAGVASCVAAQLVFAAVTLATAGELPDWGQYFAFLHAFLLGELGDLTYDFVRWSPGLAVGGGYLASAAALVLLVLRRRELAVAERTAVVAIAGTTAYGIFQFAYFVDRSAPHVLPYVCLPLLLAGALWLALVLRIQAPAASRLAPYALAWAAALAVLLVAGAWDSANDRIGNTALAHVVPGGQGPIAAIDRLVHFPPLTPAASEGERMLKRFLPGERLSLVLAQPNVANETLMRSGRANRLPIADAWEDSFVPDESVPPIRDAVGSLRSGRRLLLDSGMVFALAALRTNPRLDPLQPAVPGSPAAPVQVFALSELRRRFRLEPVHRGGGWVVMRLARR